LIRGRFTAQGETLAPSGLAQVIDHLADDADPKRTVTKV
jgi:hypothetical protein